MNHATRKIVSTVGIILGISGMNHGFFEFLQGNQPTGGLIVQAIGPVQRMWVHGTEEAFTLLPNFLMAGVFTMLVGLVIIIWSVGYIDKKHGATVFILLFLLLFLVGGGIGQIVFFLPTWAVATRINKLLTWWKQVHPEKTRMALSKLWHFSLAVSVLSFLIALEIAIFGFFPVVNDPEVLLYTCWSFLLVGLVVLHFTFLAGFMSDIQALQLSEKI